MSEEIMAEVTEVDQPLMEDDLLEGQVEDTGDEASAAEISEDDLFNLDEYSERMVRLKVDGEEVIVPLKEALSGYQRQADYTRKTQELSKQKQGYQIGIALQEALTQNPAETLQLLQQHYGIVDDVQAEENSEDLFQDPIARELDELKRWKRELEYERTLGTVERELKDLENRYGEDFDREEVIAKALATGSSDLEATFKLIQFDKIYAERKQATDEVAKVTKRVEAKRSAQVVSSGTSPAGAPAPQTAPKSVLEAWQNAQKALGL